MSDCNPIMPNLAAPQEDLVEDIDLHSAEKPVPRQVINLKTINNEKKVNSVVQMVALQINCKLGGELWGCEIPMENLMVCFSNISLLCFPFLFTGCWR